MHLPPVPRQYPCVQFTVFENDSVVAGNTLRFAEGAFQADEKTGVTHIGANRLELRDGETSVRFQGGDPAVSAEMTFKSRFSSPAFEQAIFPGEIGMMHRWILPQPRCDVEGQINLNGRQVRFGGIGYHDHYFGTGPIGPPVRQWLRGRAILRDRTVAFHVCTDHASGMNQYFVVAVDDTHAARIDDLNCSCDWNRRTWRGLTFPSAVNFGELLLLRGPRIVDASLNSLQVLFDAYINGEACTAWGEIAYPARLHKGLGHWGVMKWLAG